MTMKQFKEKYEKRKRVKGVSMVSLVITIIVILILTAIVFVGSMKTIDEADYSKYVSNVSDVSTAFREASTAVNGDKTAEGNQKNEEQVYNYVANAGNKEEDFLVPNEIPRYTIIKDDARIGIKLPEMKVESGTGKRVIVQYVTTKKGVIFTWPPYNYGDELHITDKDTVEHKMQTTITVGDETFEIELDPIDGTLKDLPVTPAQPGGGGNEDNIDPDEPEEPVVPPHEHVFSSQTVTHEYLCSAATCTSAATYYYKCVGCDEKGTSTYTSGNALGHDYSSKNTSSTYLKSQATCTSPAEYYYKCVSCTQKGTETYTHGAKGNHSFGGYTTEKEANCSETGSQKRTCTKCNTIETAVIPKDASKHANIVETVLTEASCTTAGLKKVYCDSCDTVINEETIASKGHNFVGVTCTTGGTCSNCGATTVALGHDWNSATPRVCKRCGAVDEVVHYNLIPEGATYYVQVGDGTELGEYSTALAVYNAGESFPTTVNIGDTYVYGDYEYRYGQYYESGFDCWFEEGDEGWDVKVLDTSKVSYGPLISSINGKELLNMTSTFEYCTNMKESPEIPQTVKWLSFSYCYCSSLESTPEIPSSVQGMFWTFSDCIELTDEDLPNIPSNVTKLHGAFEGCHGLRDVSNFVIHDAVTDTSFLFRDCINLQDDGLPTLPNSIVEIQSMFAGCDSLVDISNYKLPPNIKSTYYLFRGCEKLEKAPQIPMLVTQMGGTFEDCKSLKYEGIPIIPDSVTQLNYTFRRCYSLEKAPEIPDSVKEMQETFMDCTALVDVSDLVIPNATSQLKNTFKGCTALVDASGIILPETRIALDNTFYGCKNLKTAPVISSGVYDMNSVFVGCNSLTGIIQINTKSYQMRNNFSGGFSNSIVLRGTGDNLDALYVFKSSYANITIEGTVNFKISGSIYPVVEGSTFEEWVESEYNRGNYQIVDGIIYNYDKSRKISGVTAETQIYSNNSFSLVTV